MDDTITVEVVYAAPNGVALRRVQLLAGSSVVQAVEASHLLMDIPGIDFDASRLGIFSRRVGPADIVRDGDRVEIYRPLTRDPMDARRRRARRR